MQLGHILKRKQVPTLRPPGWNAAVVTATSDLAEEGGPLGCQSIRRGASAADSSMEQSHHHTQDLTGKTDELLSCSRSFC